jgi:hypothetical protein
MLQIRRSRYTVRQGTWRGRTAFRRLAPASGVAAVALLGFAANAVAGTAINVGTPFESGPPAVAVDSAGEAIIAWANTKDLAPVTTNIVQYCVLPVGAVACAHTGNLVPADSGSYIDGVQVLADGGTIIVLADVFGTAGESSGDYIPEQEWQSTDGGATFALVNGGRSVADGILSADTGPLSAVIVPGTGVLGYGWQSAAGNETYGAVPTFNAFPLSSPPECSTVKCPASFAALEPNTNPDAIGNPGGQFASQLGANPGIIGIFKTIFTNGPLGCATGFGYAYAYGSGDQSASNNYNVSPGSAGSAWKVPVTQGDCNVEYEAIGGGPSGFGVLEDNTANQSIVYHRFDQAKSAFDTPLVTIAAGTGEQDPAVSQDGTGGVYGTFLFGGGGGPISLAYSANGGSTWTGPATLNANTDGGAGNVNSAVDSAGMGWAVWTDNGSVFAQSFTAKDAVPPTATVAGHASAGHSTVTLTITCPASETCTVTITITATEVVVVKASVARKRTRKRLVTLAAGTFTVPGKGSKKLSLRLTGAGKRLLAREHGHVKASFRLSTKTAAGVGLTTKSIEITGRH